MASSGEIQELLAAALLAGADGATLVGKNVFTPRTRPTAIGEMPVILVQSPTERKENVAGRNGAPQFHVRTQIQVIGRVTALNTADESGAMALLAVLGALQGQIEVAAINDYELRRAIQQYAAIEVVNKVSQDGEQLLGELVMSFDLEFYQGPEDFAPNPATSIAQLALYADLVNIFSPTGAFSDTPFSGAADLPPRSHGPDGRAEGAVLASFDGQSLDFSDPDNSGLEPTV